MKELKPEYIFVMFGFGLSYVFFGLSLILDEFPMHIRLLTGFFSLCTGAGFIIFALMNSVITSKK